MCENIGGCLDGDYPDGDYENAVDSIRVEHGLQDAPQGPDLDAAYDSLPVGPDGEVDQSSEEFGDWLTDVMIYGK